MTDTPSQPRASARQTIRPRWWWPFRRPARRSLGKRAELAAAKHLRRHGYRILGRNVGTRLGEIDLVAEEKASGTIVIVEVKAAATDTPPPESRVGWAKQRKLAVLAADLVRRRGWGERVVRFDVVGVVWPEDARAPTRLTHYPNAFEAPA